MDTYTSPENQGNEILGGSPNKEYYNPNQLVVYKKIAGTHAAPEAPEYVSVKVVDLEWELHNLRDIKQRYDRLYSLVNNLEEQIIEWANPNYDKDEVIAGICEYFGINPTKEIEVEGTISFSGTISVPLSEVADFDLSNVNLDVTIDSYDYSADLSYDDISLEERY